MWLEPEDLEIEIERDRKKKAEEKSENKRQGYATRQKIRATRPVEKWTPTDVVNYYAEMVKTVWHLEEVATTARPKFIKMLANFRDDFGTNGAEEKELLDRFISKNRHDTEKRDPDRLFTSFIYTAPSMLDEVRRAMVPELLPPADKYNRKGL